MNIQQVRWAEQHDWFVEARLIESSPLVGQYMVFAKCGVVGKDRNVSWEEFATESFEELRAWAGY